MREIGRLAPDDVYQHQNLVINAWKAAVGSALR